MKPFAKILVPIDFTSCSAAAVDRAVALAAELDAEIVLAHVWASESYTTAGYLDFTPRQLARLSQEALKRLDAARLDAEALGVRHVTTRLLYGKPAASIIELAEQEQFDLIVVGTHGRTGLDRWISGSVAEEVARAAPCSVLTAKRSNPRETEAIAAGRSQRRVDGHEAPLLEPDTAAVAAS